LLSAAVVVVVVVIVLAIVVAYKEEQSVSARALFQQILQRKWGRWID
jgi:membrane protease YdiL (CAAX protease family)